MTWEELTRKMMGEHGRVVERAALQFNIDIAKAWPVDTGRSRAAWKLEKKGYDVWEVSNNVNYSQYLWWGLPLGSNQMPAGGNPILRKTQLKLMKNLERLAK